MSDNEAIFATLNRIEGKLDTHISISTQQHTEMKIQLTKGEMRMNATDEVMNNHADVISEITKLKNKAIGFAAAFILVGSLLTFILKLILS